MKIQEDSLLPRGWRPLLPEEDLPLEDPGMKTLRNRPQQTGGTKEAQCGVPWVGFITAIPFLRVKFSMNNEQLTLPSIKHDMMVAESMEQALVV